VLIAIAAAGCGGGGRLSELDFQAKGNATCAKYNAKIRNVYRTVPPDPVSLARALQKAIRFAEKGTDELSDLKPPERFDAQFKKFLNINRREIPTARALGKAAQRRDQAGIAAATVKLRLQGRDADRLAKQMGLNTCAEH
jgi:hypothetical protein